MTSSYQELRIDDAVVVRVSSSISSTPLSGVIAYKGTVKFSSSSSGTEQWYGIRLIDPLSRGKGNNDGSVDGVRYFENCGKNNGIFAKRKDVTKKFQKRLDEIRWKRQHGAQSGTTGATGTSSLSGTPRKTRSSGIGLPKTIRGSSSTNNDDDASSVTSMGSRMSMTSTRSRLDEIREKREKNKLSLSTALKSKNTTSAGVSGIPEVSPSGTNMATSKDIEDRRKALEYSKRRQIQQQSPPSKGGSGILPPTTPSPASNKSNTSSTPPLPSSSKTRPVSSASPSSQIAQEEKSSEDTEHLRQEINNLREQLQEKTNDCQQLQTKLDDSEKHTHDANLAKEESQSELFVLQRKLEKVHTDDNDNDKNNNINIKFQEENKNLTQQLQSLQQKLQTEQQSNETLNDKIQQLATHTSALKKELGIAKHKLKKFEKEEEETQIRENDTRNVNLSNLHKERVELKTQITTIQKRVHDLINEKINVEQLLEEITLDKEVLEEKLEKKNEQLEDLQLDMEIAKEEYDAEIDTKTFELEDYKRRAEQAEARLVAHEATLSAQQQQQQQSASDDDSQTTSTTANVSVNTSTNMDKTLIMAISDQNAKLRNAIGKLKEETTRDKANLNKKLRAAEKKVEHVESITLELNKLKIKAAQDRDTILSLEEAVDKNTHLDREIEELSERIITLEDENDDLLITIRQLEELGELSAEEEEILKDDIKTLELDMEKRDTEIFNLKEAVKKQRIREQDLQNTCQNYQNQLTKVEEDKRTLLTLKEGGEEMKTQLYATTQRALAQAAQLINDAADSRKREASATFHIIDSQISQHLSNRLESFMPKSVTSSEIAAIKGELLLSKVTLKASLCLEGISTSFDSVIKDSVHHVREIAKENQLYSTTQESKTEGPSPASKVIIVSESNSDKILNMIHQTKFTHLAIQVASECIRFLSVGQWPGVLSTNESSELGSSMLSSVPQLDSVLSEQLSLLKEEGTLSPYRSNLNALEQTLKQTFQNASFSSQEAKTWSHPGLMALKEVSLAKFSTIGSASIMASALSLDPEQDKSREGDINDKIMMSTIVNKNKNSQHMSEDVINLLEKMNQISTESSNVCQQLTGLNITEEDIVENVKAYASKWREEANQLFEFMSKTFVFSNNNEPKSFITLAEVSECSKYANATFKAIKSFLSYLRISKIALVEGIGIHAFSPETKDPWGGVVKLATNLRSLDGENSDINYLTRATGLEQKLTVAVEDGEKLGMANKKLESMKEELSTCKKEISLQNSRLVEYQELLQQSSTKVEETPDVSIESLNKIKRLEEEIQKLNKAFDKQNKKKISSLENSQKIQNPSKRIESGNASKSSSESLIEMFSLEAALFRPALRSARLDAAKWKAKSMENTSHKLPPLNLIPKATNANEVDNTVRKCYENILLSSLDVHVAKANTSIIYLGNKHNSDSIVSARMSMRKELHKTSTAVTRLREASSLAQVMITRLSQ